jgi:hypothetical protein
MRQGRGRLLTRHWQWSFKQINYWHVTRNELSNTIEYWHTNRNKASNRLITDIRLRSNFQTESIIDNGTNTELTNMINKIILWRWYITVKILSIIYLPVFYLKHSVSETRFCPFFRWNLLSWAQQSELVCLLTPATTLTDSVYYLLSPTEYVAPEDGDRIQSPKRFVLNKRQDKKLTSPTER